MVDDGCPLLRTATGRYFDDDLRKEKRSFEPRLMKSKSNWRLRSRRKMTKSLQMTRRIWEIVSRLALAEQERRRMDVDIARKSKESDKRIQELAQ